MANLFFVSLFWAFSFGLIKTSLTGLDSNLVATLRLSLALLAFLPFLRLRRLHPGVALRLALTGAVQFGVMYVAYTAAFQYLQAYEVALFTIFTPLFVTLIQDAFQRHFQPLSLAAALLAVAGALIVKQGSLLQADLGRGFLLVQISTLAFAFGQIYYTRLMQTQPGLHNHQVFALLYLGGTLTAVFPALFTTRWAALTITPQQAGVLVYLGVLASGLGFFLWNVGARQVSAGALAVFNNLKIPLAVAVSLIFFGERTSLPHLLVGGGVILAALWLNEKGLPQRHLLSKPSI